MKKATFVKDVSDEFTGQAELFHLSPPLIDEGWDYKDGQEVRIEKQAEFVVVSSTIAPFTGPETFIFPADKDGQVDDWSELPGSGRGIDIHSALSRAGYEVVRPA